METRTLNPIEQEIRDINKVIRHLQEFERGYKPMVAGNYTHNELRNDIEELIKERNKLLTQIS